MHDECTVDSDVMVRLLHGMCMSLENIKCCHIPCVNMQIPFSAIQFPLWEFLKVCVNPCEA